MLKQREIRSHKIVNIVDKVIEREKSNYVIWEYIYGRPQKKIDRKRKDLIKN